MSRSGDDGQLPALLAALPGSVFVVRADGTFISALSESTALGAALPSFVGRHLREALPAADAALCLSVLERVITEQRAHSVDYRVLVDGALRWFRARVAPMETSEAERHVLWYAQDIHDTKLESRARQAETLESIGRLAGGIAHDYNNLLTAIFGYAELLDDQLCVRGDASNNERHDLAEIQKAAERARELTMRLLAFSRQLPVAPRVLDVNQLVQGMERLIRQFLGNSVEYNTVLSAETGRVLADPMQLERVLLNLAVNARDAMPNGGRLTMATRRRELTSGGSIGGVVVGPTVLPPGEYVELSIGDTGAGMPSDFIPHAFEPFVSTKEPGSGTGLGLATVYGAVTQAGGAVVVDSTLGEGTTFRILLPRAHSSSIPTPSIPVTAIRGAGEVILVAEDDANVRALTLRTLRDAGYEVLAAEDGAAAIELSVRPGLHLDLVITDVVMPNKNGWELAAAIRSTHPRTRVLFASGFAPSTLSPPEMGDREIPFLSKPFTPSELLVRVREMLAGEGE